VRRTQAAAAVRRPWGRHAARRPPRRLPCESSHNREAARGRRLPCRRPAACGERARPGLLGSPSLLLCCAPFLRMLLRAAEGIACLRPPPSLIRMPRHAACRQALPPPVPCLGCICVLVRSPACAVAVLPRRTVEPPHPTLPHVITARAPFLHAAAATSSRAPEASPAEVPCIVLRALSWGRGSQGAHQTGRFGGQPHQPTVAHPHKLTDETRWRTGLLYMHCRMGHVQSAVPSAAFLPPSCARVVPPLPLPTRQLLHHAPRLHGPANGVRGREPSGSYTMRPHMLLPSHSPAHPRAAARPDSVPGETTQKNPGHTLRRAADALLDDGRLLEHQPGSTDLWRRAPTTTAAAPSSRPEAACMPPQPE
jgi:hypothetical protein